MLLSPEVSFISLELPLSEELHSRIKAQFHLPESLIKAHPKRQEKFLAGRYCASLAFEKLGEKLNDLPIAVDGSPLWPLGWVGSITHTEGFAMAAVAGKATHQSLGIDTEPVMETRTLASVSGRIFTGKELSGVKPPHWSEAHWGTFVFSAKESIYKCLRPLCGRFFGFEDAEIDGVDLDSALFRFHLTRDIGGAFSEGWKGEGRFVLDKNFIHTAVELRT